MANKINQKKMEISYFSQTIDSIYILKINSLCFIDKKELEIVGN